MAGNLEKRQKGQPSPAFKADWANAVTDAAAYYHGQIAGGQASGNRESLISSSGIISIKNLTGSDLVRGNVVQVGDYLCDYSSGAMGERVSPIGLIFEGNLYSASANGKLAVVLSAVAAVRPSCPWWLAITS